MSAARDRSRSKPDSGHLEAAASVFLNCPRCGLSIRPRASWLAIEYCPRCLARSRLAVRVVSSVLPAQQLYHQDSMPHPHEHDHKATGAVEWGKRTDGARQHLPVQATANECGGESAIRPRGGQRP
jgi:Zn-finger nucleic acid-binding protein